MAASWRELRGLGGGTSVDLDDLTAKQYIKRRLGAGGARPASFERAVLDGTLVVATDGLFSYATPEVLARVAAEHEDLDETGEALVRAVRLPSGVLQDDVAVVLMRRARDLGQFACWLLSTSR